MTIIMNVMLNLSSWRELHLEISSRQLEITT